MQNKKIKEREFMKKILSKILVAVICVITVFSLAACAPAWSGFSNSVQDETINGGIAVKHDGYLYFINGTKSTSETANQGNIVKGAIYRIELGEDGEVEFDEDDKTVKTPEKVVNALVGFKNGSIHIFGNYLYYATTSNRVNESDEVLFGQIEFARYDIKSGNSETFYTTKKSNDTISYAYYLNDDKIDFVIFEKNSATLTSLSISDKIETNFVKDEITGALMGENFGVSEKTTTGNVVDDADCYVYYTKAANPDGEFVDGNRVYFASSDGEFDELLSERNEVVSLFSVTCGKLIYTVDSYIYADNIDKDSRSLSYNPDDLSTVISFLTYEEDGEQLMFVDRNGELAVLVYTGSEIKWVDWSDYPNFDPDDTVYNFGDSDTKVEFVGVEGDYLYFTRDKKLNKIKVLNTTVQESPIALTSTTFDAASDLMVTKLMDGYAYGFVTSSSNAYLYRVSLADPTGSEVEAGKFIGVKE